MRQKISFWTSPRGLWRSLCSAGRVVQLAIMAFVVMIGTLALAEAVHKPIVADHAIPHHVMPASHTK